MNWGMLQDPYARTILGSGIMDMYNMAMGGKGGHLEAAKRTWLARQEAQQKADLQRRALLGRQRAQQIFGSGGVTQAGIEELALEYPELAGKYKDLLPDIPKTPSAIQEAQWLADPTVPPEEKAAYYAANKSKATSISLEKPLTISDITKMVNEKGESPPPGITASEAFNRGYTVKSAQQQAEDRKSGKGTNLISIFENLAFGTPNEPGLFSGGKGVEGLDDLLDKAVRGGEAWYEQYAQTDPRFKAYEDFRQGGVAMIAKAMGEAGNLAKEDIERAIRLLPQLYPWPDSEAVARRKFRMVREALAGIEEKYDVDLSNILVDENLGIVPSAATTPGTDDPLGLRGGL